MDRPLLGQILLQQTSLTEVQLQEALELQKEKPQKLGEILVRRLKYLKEEDIYRALSVQLQFPYEESLVAIEADEELIKKIPINFAKKHEVIPIRKEDDSIVVATSNPLNTFALDDLSLLLGVKVIPHLALPGEILDAINRAYGKRSEGAEEMMNHLEESLDEAALEITEPEDLLDVTEEAPIIRLVNSLLFQAVKERASDIHIEPFETELSVRFRIDGVLYEVLKPPKAFQPSIISRVKVMAGLNIAEKRLPQDGRIRLKIAGKDIDSRISTVPTAFGERIVMRLLDRSSVMLGLNEIGLVEDQFKKFEKLIQRNNGIILVTGPTGCGKTTTLYAALARINSPEINIITIEDPIEYQLKGIGQIQVNPKIDLTFANGLRSILRQDPDVILVGEIRDVETAGIAIHASLTGHLVFSTLHTNDAAGAITRLIDMGIEPFLVSSSLMAILAQRLVRLVCPACREKYTPGEDELRDLGVNGKFMKGRTVYRSKGCKECSQSGYKGRTGIFELLIVDDNIRGLITKGVDSATIKKKAISKAMKTLREDGARKVLSGETTIEEILRVTQEEITDVVEEV